MIREVRMYFRLRPYVAELRKEFSMKLSVNVILQIIATAVQAANGISDLLPPEHQTTVALIVTVVQAIVALIAHFSQPPKKK